MEKIISVLIMGYENPKASLLASELIPLPDFNITLDKNVKPLSSYTKDEFDIVIDFSEISKVMLNYIIYKENGWALILETGEIDYNFLIKEIQREEEKKITSLIDKKISKGRGLYLFGLENFKKEIDQEIFDEYEQEILIEKENGFSYHNFVSREGITEYGIIWREGDKNDLKKGFVLAIRFIAERKYFFPGKNFNMVDVVGWKKK